MKRKIVYILPGLFAIAFIILVLVGNLGPGKACKDKKAFVSAAYKAVIMQKYYDKENHNFRTIKFSDGNRLFTMVLVDDTSRYFDYIKVGDTILKIKNSEFMKVNGVENFRIYFDCK